MRVYVKVILYSITFPILFYNPFIAFIVLIATHGFIWYFEKNRSENTNPDKSESSFSSPKDDN
jgi:hypothetical protein